VTVFINYSATAKNINTSLANHESIINEENIENEQVSKKDLNYDT